MPIEPNTFFLNLILGAAACVSAVTGFGYALIAIPFLVLLVSPSVAVPVVLISANPLAIVLIWGCYREMTPRRILHLLLFALIGMPIGVHGLATLPAATTQTIIGCTTIASALILLVRRGEPLVKEGPAKAVAGLLSGLIGGASGMTGPPVVLLGLKQRWEHKGFRADLIGYFFLLHASMVVVFGQVGLLGGDALTLTAKGVPGVVVGVALGLWLKRRVDSASYRRLAIGLVAVGGISATLLM